MFNNKIYELSLVKTYVSHWGLNEALRELVQNALDSESPFVYELKTEADGSTTFYLNSAFTVLQPQTLLLGATSKADNAKAIGSFGEGFKIALLVLTRLGYEVAMQNGPNLWKPMFKFNKNFGDDLLVIEETPITHRKNQGLTFVVKGLTQSDVEALVASCIRMQKHIGAIKMTTKGDILLEQPGKLYVGGLFICETDLKFGYNINPELVRLERDRQTVNHWDLKSVTCDMWYETKEFDRVAKMIDEKYPDLEYAQYNSPELVKEACYQIFRQRHPDGILASSAEEMQKKVSEGMTKTVFVGGGTFQSLVGSSRSYRASLTYTAPVQIIQPTEYLKQWLSANRKEMRGNAIIAFKDIIKESEKWFKKS